MDDRKDFSMVVKTIRDVPYGRKTTIIRKQVHIS